MFFFIISFCGVLIIFGSLIDGINGGFCFFVFLMVGMIEFSGNCLVFGNKFCCLFFVDEFVILDDDELVLVFCRL